MADTWKTAPVVFEWYGSYEDMTSRGWSFDAAVNFMLSNHVTMINNNIGRVPPEVMPQLEKLARLAGYRFVLREAAHAPAAKRGGQLAVDMKWANTGVGKLYRPYKLQLLLLDAAGKTACTSDAKADPRTWLPGEVAVSETLAVPATLPAGDYTLALSFVDPTGQRPPLHLAMDAPEHAGVYTISKLKIE